MNPSETDESASVPENLKLPVHTQTYTRIRTTPVGAVPGVRGKQTVSGSAPALPFIVASSVCLACTYTPPPAIRAGLGSLRRLPGPRRPPFIEPTEPSLCMLLRPLTTFALVTPRLAYSTPPLAPKTPIRSALPPLVRSERATYIHPSITQPTPLVRYPSPPSPPLITHCGSLSLSSEDPYPASCPVPAPTT